MQLQRPMAEQRARSPSVLARVVLTAFSVCLGMAPLAQAGNVTDASGRSITVTDSTRIVSIGGAVTEILYALHLEGRIVGVDSTSLYPSPDVKAKPNVGYMRALSAEGVLGLNPSLVIAAEGAGPKEAVAVMREASVPFVQVADDFTGEGVLEKVRIIASATDAAKTGDCLARRVSGDLQALAQMRRSIDRPKRVLFVLSLLNGRPMVAGRKTAADGIIALAGGENAISSYEGYKNIGDEAIMTAQPDVVLVMRRSQDDLDADAVFSHPAFSLTPAATSRAFVSMEGLYLLGFGPRTAAAARDLSAQLYPALTPTTMPSERQAAECR